MNDTPLLLEVAIACKIIAEMYCFVFMTGCTSILPLFVSQLIHCLLHKRMGVLYYSAVCNEYH